MSSTHYRAWQLFSFGYSPGEVIDTLLREIPGLSKSAAETIANDVEYSIDIVPYMNNDPLFTVGQADLEGRFEGDISILARVRMGRDNPAYFEFEIPDGSSLTSVAEIEENIRTGRNTYGLSPRLIARLINYPGTSGIEIVMIIPR